MLLTGEAGTSAVGLHRGDSGHNTLASLHRCVETQGDIMTGCNKLGNKKIQLTILEPSEQSEMPLAR